MLNNPPSPLRQMKIQKILICLYENIYLQNITKYNINRYGKWKVRTIDNTCKQTKFRLKVGLKLEVSSERVKISIYIIIIARKFLFLTLTGTMNSG